MHTNTLSNALPIVAAAYGRKFGVSVQVGGDQAATDGQVIRLPSIQEDPTTKTLVWGYLAHEAGHVRHTDFTAWKSVTHHPLTRAITNILEDVRTENAMIATYPGVRHTLDAVLDWMVQEGRIAAPKVDQSPPSVLANALLVLARHRYRKQPALAQIAQESERVLRQVFPTSFVHRLLGLMPAIGSLKTTADVVELARRMVALIEEEADQEANPQPQASPEQKGTGGTQEDQDDNPHHSGDLDQAVSSDADQDQRGDSASAGTDGSQDQPQDGVQDANARSSLNQVLSAGEGDLPKDVFETVAQALGAQGHGTSVPMLPTLEPYHGDRRQGQSTLNRVKVHSAKLTARLQGLVQAHTMTAVRTVRRGRALSPAHLHRVAVGDSRVFARREERQAPNTAIHLLVDLSGSMAGGQDRVALEAAMALVLALEPIRGVSRAVTAFPGVRGEDHWVTRILSHGDRVNGRAGAFVQGARGSTPMTGALWYAAADLLPRKEERKVLITLTDGEPDEWDSAADIIAKASAAGIELIGIGIQQDVSRLFPVAIRIASVEDLKAELFRIAERLLLA